jgi:hypothetical protein
MYDSPMPVSCRVITFRKNAALNSRTVAASRGFPRHSSPACHGRLPEKHATAGAVVATTSLFYQEILPLACSTKILTIPTPPDCPLASWSN